MGQPGRVSWVSRAASWVATRLRGALVWLQAPTRHHPTSASAADPAALEAGASPDEGSRRDDGAEPIAPPEALAECRLEPSADDAPWTAAPECEGRCGEPAPVDDVGIDGPLDAEQQSADRLTPTAPAESPHANPASAVADDAPAPAIDLVTGLVPQVCLKDRLDGSPGSDRLDSDLAQTPARPQEIEPDFDPGAGPDSTDAAPADVPAPCAAATAWPASREHAERLAALLAGSPVACGSAAAEELTELIDDEEFSAIVTLIAGSDRTFDDLRLPAAKHAYERIMARPLGLREPVRFREPVHDLGVLQMLYAALREFAQREGVPLIIPPAGVTARGPTGEIVAHPAWLSTDALGQALRAPDPDLRAANGRVLARLFPHLAAHVLQPALIATLTSAPKARRKATVRNYGSGPRPADDPPIDAAVIPGDPAAGIWLRGHGTAAWTIRVAMSRGTRMLDVGELDRVRREIELAAWESNCRRRVVAAVAAYVADPHGYDIEQIRKRIARKDLDPAADTPFACHDEQALFDAWRRARREADIPFDRSIGMPTVNVLAPDLIARIAPPFCAMLGVAPVEASIAAAPEQPSYVWDLRDDAA